jgi:hypothetical protein
MSISLAKLSKYVGENSNYFASMKTTSIEKFNWIFSFDTKNQITSINMARDFQEETFRMIYEHYNSFSKDTHYGTWLGKCGIYSNNLDQQARNRIISISRGEALSMFGHRWNFTKSCLEERKHIEAKIDNIRNNISVEGTNISFNIKESDQKLILYVLSNAMDELSIDIQKGENK